MDGKTARLLRNGFKIMPVKFDKHSRVLRYVFYKAHHVRDTLNDMPSDRTLFVINIPPYVTKECMERLFERFGPVEEVHFQCGDDTDNTLSLTKRVENTGYQAALLVFQDESHLKAAMSEVTLEPIILLGASFVTGIKKWAMEYNTSIPKVVNMKTQIDDFMEAYDKKKDEELQKEKETAGVPDDDGWVTVSRRSKRSILTRTKAKEQKIRKSEMKKKSQKELQNFYSFQMRETRMEHIMQLRRKFQADKQRIAGMKASRKFKPY